MQKNFGVNVCTIMSMMSQKLMPSACEVDIAGVLRRSIVAARDLPAGAQLSLADLDYLRPRDGLPANPQGWLVTVARRRAIDQYRSLSAAARRELTLVYQPQMTADGQTMASV